MPEVELERAAGLAYREAAPEGGSERPPVLLVLAVVTAPLSLLAAVIASTAVLVAVAVGDTRADAELTAPPRR